MAHILNKVLYIPSREANIGPSTGSAISASHS